MGIRMALISSIYIAIVIINIVTITIILKTGRSKQRTVGFHVVGDVIIAILASLTPVLNIMTALYLITEAFSANQNFMKLWNRPLK